MAECSNCQATYFDGARFYVEHFFLNELAYPFFLLVRVYVLVKVLGCFDTRG